MAYGFNFSKVVSILTKHMKLLPLQGVRRIALIPRVLPWARCFWAFSPCGARYLKYRCTDLAEPVEFLAAHFCYG